MRFGPLRVAERRRALVASCFTLCGLPKSIFGELGGTNDIAPVVVGVIAGLVIGVAVLFLLGAVLRCLWNTTPPTPPPAPAKAAAISGPASSAVPWS